MRKSTAAGTVGYVYAGQQAVLELDGAGAVRAWNAFYPGVDRPYLMERAGARYFYLTEVPGHVTGVIDSTGTLVNQYRYTPWGEAEHVREQVENPLRFTAREYDAETGLYFYRARYYDPALARFLSEDPIGLEGGINPYAYAGNDPVNFTDPFGLCANGYKRYGGSIGGLVSSSYAECPFQDRAEIPWGLQSDPYGSCPNCRNELSSRYVEEEVRFQESLTTRDRVVLGSTMLAGVAGMLAPEVAIVGRSLLSRLSFGAAVAASGKAAVDARTALPNGAQLLVIVKDGRVWTNPITTSHGSFVQRVFGTASLPEGAWAGTMFKADGMITALNSRSMLQNQNPAPYAVVEVLRSTFK